ncbi:hypothetical protein B0H16DRAFT_1496301 [Mycena metata]|uniref:DUF6533 domain-containing protein n=1 Tax=Mycena metata TaxID=1033252 RepID=A0AAD7KF00_9AGAR|nr:hypothetical protein B0H16DRAFT_1496301 [Mycena metata]
MQKRPGVLEVSAYAGLTFALSELILTFREERTYIWKNPQGTTPKVLYSLSRYFAFAVHITNAVFATLLREYKPIPTHLCRVALVYQGAVLLSMLSILDAILMIRVYALYNRPPYLAGLFICILVSKVVSLAITTHRGLPDQRFSPTCLVLTGSQSSLYLLAGSEFVIQATVLGLTLRQHAFATRGGWSHPLFRLLTRDGSIAFIAIAGVLTAILAISLQPVAAGHLLFPIMVVIMSTAGCRLILNMQKLATPVSGSEPPEPVLTTMRDNAWSARSERSIWTTGTSTFVSDISIVNFTNSNSSD